MAWSERQQAMLREMGLRVWAPPAVADADGDALGNLVEASAVDARGDAGTPVARPGAAEPEPVHRAASVALTRAATPPVAAAPTVVADGAARPRGVESMDWPSLREAVAACTACGLCKTRTQTVFGVGHEQAHWMVVGEAPGEQEDLKGEPFVGPSGQLLDNMLRAIGLTRGEAPPSRQVYIANSVKCRPPGNRNPTPEELAMCEPFLIRQVALVQPKIILAMGKFAVQSLLRSSEPIGKLRGRVHHYQGVPLIVTYHPAYLLRSPTEKARAWDDLCLAVETVNAV